MSALDQLQVEASLEGFLRQVRPRLKALFGHFKIPPQDTEDILQQALLALLYRPERVRDPEAWLLGTLRNKCLLYWREKKRKLYESVDTSILERMAEPLAPAQEGADFRKDLESALECLPERCRSLLSLRFELGYEPPEVAERMGYSPASISKVTTRCLDALTRHMVYPTPRGKKARHG
ncbi:MAG TPA: sigma-70 family RNA polymerase sigma factor [Thermoanaerobaculia bacterium]|jgi:RNA polymerase sigma-70 factor (ECF subfamily)